MKRMTSAKIIHRLRRMCKQLISDRDGFGEMRELKKHAHLIRGCYLTVRSASRDFSLCPKDEEGNPMILEDALDFCEISGHDITSSSLQHYLNELSQRRSLTYGEIACIVPSLIYCCICGFCNKKCEENTLIRSLQVLHGHDCSSLAEELSKTEEVLNKDRFYPLLEKGSKELYRKKIRIEAKKQGIHEREVAVEYLKRARKSEKKNGEHIGSFLFQKKHNKLYFPVLLLVVIGLFLGTCFFVQNILLIFLSLIPVFICAKLFCDTLFSKLVSSEPLPRLKIDEQYCPKSLVTIVSLISDKKSLIPLLHRLDVFAHRIPTSKVHLGLLLDLPPSHVAEDEKDREVLDFLQQEISKRNNETSRFFCAVRKREKSNETFRFEAFGRKQGAIIRFSDLVAGDDSAFSLVCGDVFDAKYMVTLDSDTEPTPGSVESLIGFMEHPNHTPIVKQSEDGYLFVEKGYAIATPRIAANPCTSHRTHYASLLGGNSGTELYHNPHFDLYQDLFSEGIFCGKGILNLPIYRTVISARFRRDPLLSHDLPEGQFLRCAMVSDLVFFDEIPDNVLSDEKRNHRWVRGDFQNSRFLLPKENRSALFSFKIVHNLCRALFPSACFFIAATTPIFGVGALLLSSFWLSFPLLLQIPSYFSLWLFRHRFIRPVRWVGSTFCEFLLSVLLLPSKAYSACDGAVRGIYRLIFGKKLLEWTTFAQTSEKRETIGDYYYHLRFQFVGFLFLFSPKTVIAGLLWLCAPLVAYFFGNRKTMQINLHENLRNDLARMWQYYGDLMNEKNNFLPPDNYQEDPLNAVAHRTSPTNIGLGMLSILGAFDLKLLSEEELCTRLEQSLSVIESLPKWKGHLYNWYDTRSKKVLLPKFISSVDSGNWAVSLYTLKQGLAEVQTRRRLELISRIETLLSDADFTALYDVKKNLFTIGYDVREDRMTDSYYDLYASESRLTSFYAIMTHQIPIKHWNKLARPAKKTGGKLLIPGWSGTMFEFFMPHIFLPVFPKTLCSEMLRGTVSEQMRYAGKNLPWGISESGFYSFDECLNYRYYAFGVPSCALRRDHEFPKVVSPYATYLSYPFFPKHAKENLSRLPKGKYGYYEAVDYRQGDSNPRIVKSYMAHHIGMSFLSGVNVLTDFSMQKRFMNTCGEAYVGLLTEEIPTCVSPRMTESVQREDNLQPPQQRFDHPDPEHPNLSVLSNGTVTEVISDSGIGFLRYENIALTPQTEDPAMPQGIFVFIRNKGTLYPTTYAPLYPEKESHQMFFDAGGATTHGTFRTFETRLSATVSSDSPVFIRELSIKNNQMTEDGFEFFFYLKPILCSQKDYDAHPEYRDLFLRAQYNSKENTVSFCRVFDKEEIWLCISASRAFAVNTQRDSFTDFENIASVSENDVHQYPIFPALVLKGNMSVRGRGIESVRFFISAGKTKEEAMGAMHKVISAGFEQLRTRFEQSTDSFCYANNIRSADRVIFRQVASMLLFPREKPTALAKLFSNLPREQLYQYGISGDHPLLTVRIGSEGIERVLPFFKSLALFLAAKTEVDLVVVFQESDPYHAPIRSSLERMVLPFDKDVSKHIFLLDIRTVEEYLFLQKVSNYFINLERGWKITKPHRSFRPIRTLPQQAAGEKSKIPSENDEFERHKSFQIENREHSLFRPYSLVLANPNFGTVVNNRSLGYTFARNASENRLTPRPSSVAGIPNIGGEKLYIFHRGKRYDLLKNAEVSFHPSGAKYTVNCFGATVTAEVFVPKNLSAKIIRISVNGVGDDFPAIVYEPTIILGNKNTGTVTRINEGDRIYFKNPYNSRYLFGTAVLFGIHCKADGSTLRFYPTKEISQGVFLLGYANGEKSAAKLADLLSDPTRIQKEWEKRKKSCRPWLRLDSPDRDLNRFVNGFLQQQILQSRIYGRTGPNQPGGAFGFRDQLQDCYCLSTFDTSYLKHQILRCASHQFEEGDVLHWWHPRQRRTSDGIRTRFSDDPFWLVFACAQYHTVTNDRSFLLRNVPYLTAPLLSENEKDRYFIPQKSALRESLYGHCMRAFRYAYKIGKHDLILFGAGDWNDGMNQLQDGSETAWGSMFALLCAQAFLPIAREIGTKEDIAFLESAAKSLRDAIQEQGFRNGRYIRGFHTDGSLIGGENGIDLLPQAFALFCGLENSDCGMEQAKSVLWDKESGLLRLLDPPYARDDSKLTGTIAHYPPGVRENGGQYTHGALWFIKAMFESGKTDSATEMLLALNPILHCKNSAECARYGSEPYVLSADVYTLPSRFGMAGWSHYTGSAGWYLNLVSENLLGIRRKGRCITLSPNLPRNWDWCKAEFQIEQDRFRIRIMRGTEIGVYENNKKVNRLLLSNSIHEILIIV